MNRRLLFLPAAALSAVVLFAACGGSSATTAPTGAAATPAAATPAAATPAATAPAATAPVAGTPGAPASFTADTELAAKFPTTIDGQPVTNVQTGLFADVLHQLGTSDAALGQIAQTLNAVGLDLSSLSFGSATATVDGETVQLQALRTPNADANKVIQNYAVIGGAFSSALGQSPAPGPTMAQSSIAGKNVTVATDSTGSKTVLYVSGDTIFSIVAATDSQNAKILQALP